MSDLANTMVCQCGFDLSQQGVGHNPLVHYCDDPCSDINCEICQHKYDCRICNPKKENN